MRHILYLLVGITLVASLFSCQREVDGINNNNNTRQNDSIYLERVIIIDTTLPAGFDTTEYVRFFYDNQKRLTRILSIYNLSGNIDSALFEFFYSGTDTLPYKQSINETFSTLRYSDTIFYTYSNGIIIKDSLVQWELTSSNNSGAIVTEFTLSGSTVNILEKYYSYASGVYTLSGTDQGSVSVSTVSGNLISQNRLSGNAALFDKVQASYDNKPNPISKILKTKYPLLESPTAVSWILQRNNPLQVRFEEPFNAPVTENYSYIYRSDDYPIQRNYSSSYPSYHKALYFYRSL